MVYLEKFYSSVILKFKNAKIYTENLVETTQINSSSLWSAYLTNKDPCYFLSDDVSFEEVEYLIRF